MLLSDIATAFNLPLSSAAFHMKVLEDAQLVTVDYSTKRKKTLKWYTYTNKQVLLRLREEDGTSKFLSPYSQNIDIGDYIDAQYPASCGIATETAHIMEDSPHKAFIPERKNAQLIWLKPFGYLTYAIPNEYAQKGEISEINFSAEVCSEARGYNADYPSDITFWVNDIELCTYTSPGDFGDRYGKFTPPWWFLESTKYGLLVNLSIKQNGVYLNEKLINKKITVQDLNLSKNNRTTFKIGVKETAKHLGGLNIFGNKFGDYNQAISFTAIYKKS